MIWVVISSKTIEEKQVHEKMLKVICHWNNATYHYTCIRMVKFQLLKYGFSAVLVYWQRYKANTILAHLLVNIQNGTGILEECLAGFFFFFFFTKCSRFLPYSQLIIPLGICPIMLKPMLKRRPNMQILITTYSFFIITENTKILKCSSIAEWINKAVLTCKTEYHSVTKKKEKWTTILQKVYRRYLNNIAKWKKPVRQCCVLDHSPI